MGWLQQGGCWSVGTPTPLYLITTRNPIWNNKLNEVPTGTSSSSQIGRVAAGIFWRRCRVRAYVAARRRPIDTLFNRKRLSEEQIGHTVKARYARAATQQWWLRPHWSLVICEVFPLGATHVDSRTQKYGLHGALIFYPLLFHSLISSHARVAVCDV